MHIKLRDNVKTFKERMDNGTIYLEFSDGYRIALHRSLYTCEDNDDDVVYKNFIDCLISDNRTRRMTKFYYKVDNLTDPGSNNQCIWINMFEVMKNTSRNIYFYAYENRNSLGLQVDIKHIKSVRYTDKNHMVHQIDHHDGTIIDNQNKCQVINYPTRDNRYVNVSRFDILNPDSIKEHLKDDIKIEITDDYEFDIEDTLVWINGRFVETTKDIGNDNKVMYISKGIAHLNYQHNGFVGSDPLTPTHSDTFIPASYEFDSSRAHYGPDFDVKIFKWDGVGISDWSKPISYGYGSIEYSNEDTGFNMHIGHISDFSFSENIPENHIIMNNGIILDRDDYEIVGSKIILKSIKKTVNSVITDAVSEYGEITSLPYIIESFLPKGEDFRLITFSSKEDGVTIKLNRSPICFKNHPYPYHITFPDLSVGDMVLLDGIYERYSLLNQNVISYPYTDYLARYRDRNLLNETKVERVWFTKE